jgi:DNA-binding winged helix-turn-helix (wHTH) protein
VRYRFGDFEADAGRFSLSRSGRPVRIEPRPLALLIHLLERAPDAVSRDELLERLWPDAVVLEGSLTRAVRAVRRALRERADEDGAIRTVRGRGYAIAVPVEAVDGDASPPRRIPATEDGPRSSGPGRRLLAILSADMADHAVHVARDQAATETRLGALRTAADEIVAGHRGLLVHFLSDNWLAVFPSAIDATRAALAFQDRVATLPPAPTAVPMAFRVGLHLAELIEDGGRVYGGGVHVAGRLERLADPGGLCLSAAIREQIAGRLELTLEDLGDQHLKGFVEPLRIYRLAPPTAASRRS